ncbi:hypothetical protein D9613_002333 [Agrocybe pediades]|uniref:NADP-dependent oxidoreductase domain-containing protein n=1 Tax=Agrocybe pediades TaxID=84607 RepID=A0A8H4R5R8_9AGAR|nr:hypothetical protein D9613_002333 [Agrocybe pediades]
MPQLPTRKIGNDDVTAIGFGLMGLSVFYGAVEGDEERMKVLDAAYNLGCTNWDTSDFYGDNKDLLCKWFKRTGNRNKIFLATKFGLTGTGTNGSPEYVKSSVEMRNGFSQLPPIDRPYYKAKFAIWAYAKLAYRPFVEHMPFTLFPLFKLNTALSLYRRILADWTRHAHRCLRAFKNFIKSHDDIPKDDFISTIPKFGPDNFHNVLNLSNALANSPRHRPPRKFLVSEEPPQEIRT